jgi:hypothetical protein
MSSPSPICMSGEVNTKVSCQGFFMAHFPAFLYTFHDLFRDMILILFVRNNQVIDVSNNVCNNFSCLIPCYE